MLSLACPWCGPRDETEFRNGGQAHINAPADADRLSDEQWADYVYMRDNTMGPTAERWCHIAGCRRWFNAVRDTRTNQVLVTYRVDDSAARLG
jgi:heterotetrameric sarcosine oxidase delta subunit